MSAFILNNETINKIVRGLVKENSHVLRPLAKLEQSYNVATSYEDCERLVKDMLKLNILSVNLRYGTKKKVR